MSRLDDFGCNTKSPRDAVRFKKRADEPAIVLPGLIDLDNDDEKTARLKDVDLHKEANRAAHGTAEYDVENLVLRRGQSFVLTLTLNKDYDPDHDRFNILLATGRKPLRSKGTIIKVPLVESAAMSPVDWGAVLMSVGGPHVTLQLMIASDAIVGRHRLIIETFLEDDRRNMKRKTHKEEIYIIFNAWCEDDEVYMKDEQDRQAYVMNENGRIWKKKKDTPAGWWFAQFEKESLEAAIYLLENSKLKKTEHDNPVLVCRALSAMVNSDEDDNGVVMGNWDEEGTYYNGVPPSCWGGSQSILYEYMRDETPMPVKYGRCWVFSGVLTTVCRSLGIPTRSITVYNPAHDNEGDCIIDYYVDDPYDFLSDEIWDFHVLNEAWIKRKDLSEDGKYDGWQTFDATPYLNSTGTHQCGPAPVSGLKAGDVFLDFESKHIFSEFNGDEVTWEYDEDYTPKIVDLKKGSVGTSVITQDNTGEKLDITDTYKFPDGSEEEKQVISKVMHHVANDFSDPSNFFSRDFHKKLKLIEEFRHIQNKNRDVILQFNKIDNCGDVTFSVAMENTSSEVRNISVNVRLTATSYTGFINRELDQKKFEFTLGPSEKKEESLTVKATDWMDSVAADDDLAANFLCKIAETQQREHRVVLAEIHKPDVNIHVSSSRQNEDQQAIVKKNDKVTVTLEFQNTFNIKLTDILMKLEGVGIKAETIKINQALAPGATLKKQIQVSPRRKGKNRELFATLMSHQLTGVQGSTIIEVVEE